MSDWPITRPYYRQISGRYYYPGEGPVIASAAALTINSLRASPLGIGQAVTLDRISINITTLGGAGSVVRLGLYLDNGNGAPGALLLDAGTVDSTSTGLKEITISQAVPADWLWVASAAQVAVPQANQVQGVLPPIGFFTGNITSSVAMCGYVHNGTVSGALPNPFLPTTTGQPPVVVVRVA